MRVIAITLLCILLIFGIGLEAYNVETWYLARDIAKDQPNLWLTPTPLQDTSVVAIGGPRLARFGLSIQLPHKQKENSHEFTGVVMEAFPNGGSLLFIDEQLT